MRTPREQAKSIFLNALEITSPAERQAFVVAQCGNDETLRLEVQELLEHQAGLGSFLDGTTPPLLAPATPPPPPEETSTVIGPYTLLQKLGEGGMGTVWVAEQSRPVKRRVALKVIKPGMDSAQVVRRFEAERQALALMDHPNVAKVLDAGTTPGEPGGVSPGRPFFVMELVQGVPFTKYADEQYLTVRQRLELFLPVCRAIQHAHQKGIIHRDIKPTNVLVAMQDGTPVVKVIDFGIAKALHQRLTDESLATEVGSIVGTLEYMSPEQAELGALDIDTRADVYSLGVLLYELLTGTTPLGRELLHGPYTEVLRRIRDEEPPRPSARLAESREALETAAAQRREEPARLTKEVRGDLDWIAMKCLEKDRTRRYESASALARDVERHLRDEPVEACPPSLGYRLRKFARRNKPALAIAGLAGVLLLMVAGVFGLIAAQRDLRASELEKDVNAALVRAASLGGQAQSQRNNPEQWEAALGAALEEVARAEGLLAREPGLASAELQERVRLMRADLDAEEKDRRTLALLDDIKFQEEENNRPDLRSYQEANLAYQRAFKEYGIVAEETDPQQAAAVITSLPPFIASRLVLALEDWATSVSGEDLERNLAKGKNLGSTPEWFQELMRLANTDPMEARVRAALALGHEKARLTQLILQAPGAQSVAPAGVPVGPLVLIFGALEGPGPQQFYAPDESALQEVVREVDLTRQHPLAIIALAKRLESSRIALLRRAQQQYPGDFWINYDLAQALAFRASPPRYKEAESAAAAAVALRPKSPSALKRFAVILEVQRDYAGAAAAYRRAVALQPDPATYRALADALERAGDLDGAIEAYRQQIAHPRSTNGEGYDGLSKALYRKGDLDGVVEVWRQAAADKRAVSWWHGSGLPPERSNWFNLGIVLRLKGDLDGAADAFRQVLLLDPEDEGTTGHTELGKTLLQKGDLDGAIAVFRKSLELHPNFPESYPVIWAEEEKAVGLAGTLRGWDILGPRSPLSDALVQKGDFDGAAEVWRRAMDVTPKDSILQPYCWWKLGAVLQQKGDLDGAIEAFRQAVTHRERVDKLRKDLSDYEDLGAALVRKGDLKGAAEVWRQALAQQPKHILAWVHLAEALERAGDLDGAIEAYERIITFDPRLFPGGDQGAALALLKSVHGHTGVGGALLKKGDPAGAAQFFRVAVTLNPKDKDAQNGLAAALLQTGDVDAALAACHRAIEIDPQYAPAFANLGLALSRKKDFDGAVAAHRKAVELDPMNASFHVQLAIALLPKGDPDSIIAACRKAIEIDPKDATAHGILGTGLQRKGDVDGAIAAFRKAGELAAKYAYAHLMLGDLLANKGDLAGAVAAYRQAIEGNPRDASLYGKLGSVLLRKGDTEEAIAAHRQAVAADPKYAPGYVQLGQALDRKGDLDGAIGVYRQGVAICPKELSLHDSLGVALLRKGDGNGAAAVYRQAIDLAPNNALLHARLGDALLRKGEGDDAIAACRKAIEFDPNQPYAHRVLGDALAGKGDFGEAAVVYRKAVDLGLNDSYLWNCLAAAHLGAGKLDAYRGVCAEMMKQFGKTKSPAEAARALYTCLPVADALDDPAQLLPLAELAATEKGNARLLGATLYRAGKYEAAIKPLEEGQARAWDHLFLAMAHYRLGHVDKAREYLERATGQIKTAGYPWLERLESEQLRREAVTFIQGMGKDPPK